MPTIQQLLQSCEVLFGAELQPTREFLAYLQISGVKSAYRRKALETHPDRLAAIDSSGGPPDLAPFFAVQHAYRHLVDFLEWREQRPADRQAGFAAPSRPGGATSPPPVRPRPQPFGVRAGGAGRLAVTAADRFYRGPIPCRPLLFGHFLYYAGLTNWRTVSRVLAWQRLERPRLGELACRLGFLKAKEVTDILGSRPPLRRFGEAARQRGLLTDAQLQWLVTRQLRLQKRFGAILLEKRLIGHEELRELLLRFRHHNAANRRENDVEARRRCSFRSGWRT